MDYDKDPNIQALRGRALIYQGSTLGLSVRHRYFGHWSNIRVILVLGYSGIMENKMETTI